MNNKKIIKVLFIILAIVKFFGIVFFPTMWFVLDAFIVGLFAICLKIVRKRKKILFVEKCILAFCVFSLIATLYSWLVLDQELKLLLFHTYPYFGMLTYFIMEYYSLDQIKTKKIIISLSVIMNICYIIQWLIYPAILFYYAKVELDTFQINGTLRFRFVSTICSYLLLFYGLNQYIYKRELKYLLYLLLGAFPVLVMGFRSLIFMSLLSVVLMLINSSDFVRFLKYAILVSVLLYASTSLPIVQEKIEEMTERQEKESFSDSEYIRYIAFDFYESYYNEKIPQRIIGAGIPLVNDEEIAQRENSYQKDIFFAYSNKLYWNDLGIIGLSYVLGIPAVIVLIILCVYMMSKSKEKDILYIRYTMFVLLIGSVFTSQELFRDGNFAMIGILLYYLKQREIESV